MTASHSHYTGRFAPSPSGPLHMGSLVCALASYLDARQQNGKWLLRIEDIDPPREQPGASDMILRSLQNHGLHWDDLSYQSRHSDRYLSVLDQLREMGLTYPCRCTRKRLAKIDGYDGYCKQSPPPKNATVALRFDARKAIEECALTPTVKFDDGILGPQEQNVLEEGDFVVLRKDKLFAYQLAVVVDDIDQGVTHIVRGNDLLDCTAKHELLTEVLGGSSNLYSHIPVIVGADGAKLSKQTFAPPIDDEDSQKNIWSALNYLKQSPPSRLKNASISELVDWGIKHWQKEKLADSRVIPI